LDESNLFDVDPLLVSFDPLDPQFTPDSPCIDAGDPESSLDPDSTRTDIGAYYYHHEVGILERKIIELQYAGLSDIYPNPFNGVSTFAFSLNRPGMVNIEVFNSLGRRQGKLVSGSYPVGSHNVSWNGGSFPSGDYIIRLNANGQVSTRKVTLVR